MTFDKAAVAYRDSRPGYPQAVFTLLSERCGLGPGAAVLEIGAGTGQATIPMLALGATVTAFEPGPALVHELESRTRGHDVRIVHATFEDAPLEPATFDIVASATAFHWVDPRVRGPKSGRALRDGGWLAVWGNTYGDPSRPDPFHEAIQPVLKVHAPELMHIEPPSGEADDDFSDFEDPETHEVRWEGSHTPDQVRTLFSTFSPWIALPPERREPLLDAIRDLARDEFGGTVIRPYLTSMQLRRRRSR